MKQDFEDEEISLLDIWNILWSRKFMIIFITGIFAAVSLVYALFIAPVTYKAECRIAPQGGNSSSSGMLAQLGGFADFLGLSGGSTSTGMILGILEGDTLADSLIERFNLMEKFSSDIRLNVRAATKGMIKAESDRTSGFITISVIDKDPEFAAEFANAVVEEVQHRLLELSTENAIRRKTFFENQLITAQHELNEAEDALIEYQQSRGVIAFEAQTQALVSSMTNLRNRIAEKNVQISSMSSYTRADNPRLKVARSELEAMTKELRRLEEEQKQVDLKNQQNSSAGLDTIGQLPEMGIEYSRYARSVQFATAKYEQMLRQYENAKLNEQNDIPNINIIDRATVPDYKNGPKRARICIIGTAAGMALSIFLAFIFAHLQNVKERREEFEDY